jgi:alcohol dehydrogenase class IV
MPLANIRPFTHVPSGSVVFGAGCAHQVGAQGPLKKAARIAVVTDAGVKATGIVDAVTAHIGNRVVFVDDGAVPDADVDHIDALAARAKEAGADAFLAVGGGSVMDTTKCAAAVLAKGVSIRDLEGIATIRAKLVPIVAVPTTAGTGSEATQFAVVKDRRDGKKRILMDLSLVPPQSFLDPALLTKLPAKITAATGVDAITHAVEAAASRTRNPLATAQAIEAVRILSEALPKALENPDDVDARGACLVAAHMAGRAISSAMLGACHAFAHALGALKGVPHGVANGIFLGPVMRANAEKARSVYAHFGWALGAPNLDGAAAYAIEAIEKLVHETAGIPRTLAGVATKDDVDALVQLAMADADLATNPVAFDEAAVRAMFEARL